MKLLRLLAFIGFIAFTTGCTEEIISPNGDGDDSETPVVTGDPNDPGTGGG